MIVADEIEAEMRAIGLWGASGTCEHWLEHEVLPAVRSTKPPKSVDAYDRAHAEWVKWGPDDDGPKKLLALLRRLDRVLEFRPRVLRFGFYATNEGAETPGGFTCVWGRALSMVLKAGTTARVAWHIEMEHEPRERMIDMVLDWTILQKETNTIFKHGTHRSMLPPDWKQMAFAEAYGWSAPGHWKPGWYRTTISYWGETIAEDEFVIE